MSTSAERMVVLDPARLSDSEGAIARFDRQITIRKRDLNMNHVTASFFLSGALLIPGLAAATQPTDIITSDSVDNTAMGPFVLQNIAPNLSGGPIGSDSAQGVANTGVGYAALSSDTSGAYNTSVGAYALELTTTGYHNSALGYAALASNVTGSDNTAIGHDALEYSTGNQNTALGTWAMQLNTSGSGNTAAGFQALAYNASGANNTAFGALALFSNSTGKGNAAQGVNALFNNTTGIRNLGIGSNALYENVSGSYNIALGFDAGYNVTNGSNNIEIGASGTASDNGTIQIGVQGTQTSTTIAGIFGTTVTGSAVYVTATGQLGVLASSERYKTDIATMGSSTEKLEQLRPVTFKLKTDRRGTVQYGLIAEEVAKIYPELVIRNARGGIEGVRYEELAPMLLNEMQQQHKAMTEKLDAQAAEIRDLKSQLVELNDLKQDLHAALRALSLPII